MNICSSDASERESVPFFRYGPYRPFCAVISCPSAGSTPTTRGSDSSRSASSRVTVSSDIVDSRDAVCGLTAFLPVFGASSGSTSVT